VKPKVILGRYEHSGSVMHREIDRGWTATKRAAHHGARGGACPRLESRQNV